jgi:ABC-type amino acid transport substrate-binding protein
VLVFQEYPQAFLAMKQGLADAFTTIVTILEAVAKKDPGFVVVGDFLTSEPIAFGVRENDSKWRDALCHARDQIAAVGQRPVDVEEQVLELHRGGAWDLEAG